MMPVTRLLALVIVPLAGVLLLAACEGESRAFQENVEVVSLGLTAVQITPPANAQEEIYINTGQSLQVGITGTSAGSDTSMVLTASDRRFLSSNPSVLSVSEDGVVTGGSVADGESASAEVSVVLGGLISEGLTINVSNASLASISSINGSETLEACVPGDYFAVGSFDDRSTRTLYEATFALVEGSEASLNPEGGVVSDGVVSVNATGGTGITLAVQVGEITNTRELQVLQNLDSIAIAPTETQVNEGETLALTATGTYLAADASGDSRDENITANVQWGISSGTENASVGNSADDKGQLLGVAEGVATVQATCGTAGTGQKEVTVTEAINDDSDELSFNTSRSDGTLVVSLDDNEPFELKVSRGSEFDENNVETDGLTFSVNQDDVRPAINVSALQENREIVAVTAGETAVVTAILLDSDDDEIASGTLTVRVER